MKENISEGKMNAYDGIAPFYDTLARIVFGQSIFRSQLYQVPFIPPNASVLILGGGTGWLLEAILREKPSGVITFLDASEKMIALAKKRSGPTPVNFIHGRIADLPPGATYDVVIANFFFDQFSSGDLRMLLGRLRESLAPGGTLLVADFVADAIWKRALLGIMYTFFSALGAVAVSVLPPWQDLIQQGKFSPVSNARFYGGFIHSTVYRR